MPLTEAPHEVSDHSAHATSALGLVTRGCVSPTLVGGAAPLSSPNRLSSYRDRVNAVLRRALSNPSVADTLADAMRYATLGRGKRIRPALVYASGECVGADVRALDYGAAAVELIHAFSLVHDDLPAMDDDSVRRGKASCHVEYGESIAILAGDALHALAYELLSQDHACAPPAQVRMRMIHQLASASGVGGMAAGQAIDLTATGKTLSQTELELMHRLKTGSLIRASVLLGALCQPDVSANTLSSLERFAEALGLSFQIQDDVIDVTSATRTMGKPQGSDAAGLKPTYPALLGVERSRDLAKRKLVEALDHLSPLGPRATPLRDLTDQLANRRW